LNLGQTLTFADPLNVSVTVMGGLSTGFSVSVKRTAMLEAARVQREKKI
jgi:hypothetical protein